MEDNSNGIKGAKNQGTKSLLLDASVDESDSLNPQSERINIRASRLDKKPATTRVDMMQYYSSSSARNTTDFKEQIKVGNKTKTESSSALELTFN